MWWVYALMAAVFAALTTIFVKIGVTDVAPNLATAIRTVVILGIAWAIVLVSGETARIGAVSGRAWLFLTLSGIATGLSWLCHFQALHIGLASSVAAIDKSSLAMTLLLAMLFLGEPLQIKSVIGIVMIVGGTLVLTIK